MIDEEKPKPKPKRSGGGTTPKPKPKPKPAVTEEPEPEVKCPKGTHLEGKDCVPDKEPTKVPGFTPTYTISSPPKATLLDEDTVPIGEVRAVAKLFPELMLKPTQRWFAETFRPQYTSALSALKKLANI